MCGIVGYVGPRDAVPLIVGGLEKLEYRGYDSSGVATISAGKFDVIRAVGKLSELKTRLTERKGNENRASGRGLSIGIGHTRWATHGRPSETNAHPHVAGRVCVVHNGIIENYLTLRARLEKQGCVFVSETDTEIAAHLINSHFSQLKGGSLLKAVRGAVAELEGSYALVVISLDDPETLVVAKNATPVIVGVGEGETFVASDVPAILEHTRQVIILEDGELAELRAGQVNIEADGKPVHHDPTTVTWDAITAEKGGFRHFMLKEIHEQPQVVTDTFRGRVDLEKGTLFFDGIKLSPEEIKALDRIWIVACGSAWHAALVTKFYLERFTKLPVEVDYASEFRYRNPAVTKNTLFVAISQSGETADTLGSLQLANSLGAKTVAICNVVGSSIARKSGSVLYTHAGPEISVASTKAFLTQLTAGYLLALHIAQCRNEISTNDVKARLEELVHVPTHLARAIATNRQLEKIARKYGQSRDFLFLGRGPLYPVALEGALKVKEISYLHAEGYPAGEMKHGPIALITEETPVVMVLGHDGVNYEKCMSNLMEVESRGGRIIVITDTDNPALKDLAWEVVTLGEIPPLVFPIVATVPLQLLAYHIAVYRGTDVDQPRNLAKSVTVE